MEVVKLPCMKQEAVQGSVPESGETHEVSYGFPASCPEILQAAQGRGSQAECGRVSKLR